MAQKNSLFLTLIRKRLFLSCIVAVNLVAIVDLVCYVPQQYHKKNAKKHKIYALYCYVSWKACPGYELYRRAVR